MGSQRDQLAYRGKDCHQGPTPPEGEAVALACPGEAAQELCRPEEVSAREAAEAWGLVLRSEAKGQSPAGRYS